MALVCPCIAHVSCGDALAKSRLGRCCAATGKPILLLDGEGGNREAMVSPGNLFLQNGYSVLEPDLRGHGESGGFMTCGVLEEQDSRAWASWMLSQPEVIRIYGFGASESAYSDFPAIASERLGRDMGRVAFLATPVVDAGFFWTKMRYGADLRKASAVEAVRRTQVPAFLIHGPADFKTVPRNSRRMAAANPKATLWLVPGGGHANIRKLLGRAFEKRVLDWLSALE